VDAFVRLEVDDGVGVIRLDRPPANAISHAVGLQLGEVIAEAGVRDDVGAVVLWGGPRLFAAGADIKEMAAFGPDQIRPVVSALGDAIDALEAMPKISIAAVAGYALGGGLELALGADLRYLAQDATIGQPEVKIGVIPGAGGTQRLTRAVGKALAMDVILSGRFLTAQEALAAGLVARVVAEDEWLDEAKRVGQDIASKAPIATRLAKEGIDRSFEGPLQLGLEYERRLLYLAFASEDTKEGLNAFLQKRKPEFKGR
jgi:enoyl-CoA hydratase/carnithine racemase